MRRAAAPLVLALGVLLAPAMARAHVGSPDVFHEGAAGPYPLFVTVRPPEVVPGIATVEVRVRRGAQAAEVAIVPTPLTGEGADQAPRADLATPVPGDPGLFSGRLWIMERGAWRVRVRVSGAAGSGVLDVPVTAMPQRIRGMGPGLAVLLGALMALLAAALIGIVRAAAGQALQPPGAAAAGQESRTPGVVAALVSAGALALGLGWWRSEARDYAREVYTPMVLTPALSGRALTLALHDAMDEPLAPLGTRRRLRPKVRRPDDLLPDHGHLMHLFLVRVPDLDTVLHLHPDRVGPDNFTQTLPASAPGRYRLFADIVHATGMPETLTADLDVPAGGASPAGDDAVGGWTPSTGGHTIALADGTRVTWERDGDGPLPAARPLWFRFRVADGDGHPARDLAPYMGMAGHALFVARDLSVFAHVHPSGSVPMAALELASPDALHALHAAAGSAGLPPEVAFPYGFPKPGAYRIFVQVKRGDTVETAAFDADVTTAAAPLR